MPPFFRLLRQRNTSLSTAFITHEACLRHEMDPGHPEEPGRLLAIHDQLVASGLFDHLKHYEAPQATIEQLAHAHTRLHIEELMAMSPSEGLARIDPDTAMGPGTWTAALHAAGAGVLATDLVMAGEVGNAFCNVRPPGHPAERDRAMGFCFFNNVAVAAAHAMEVHGLKRVAIVDFDVHFGNGTESIFFDDERVMVCSTFEDNLYPFVPFDTDGRRLVNVPLPAGSKGYDFRDAVSTFWLPRLEEFRPQMVFISAGFDAHLEDDLAHLMLNQRDYAWVTHEVLGVADRHSKGRLVSMLEGGYALEALGRSVMEHVKVLMRV
jgi:acetoin utilization deacetylase AcuC-like enzyme